MLTCFANILEKNTHNTHKKQHKNKKNTPKTGCFCIWRREEDTVKYYILWYVSI